MRTAVSPTASTVTFYRESIVPIGTSDAVIPVASSAPIVRASFDWPFSVGEAAEGAPGVVFAGGFTGTVRQLAPRVWLLVASTHDPADGWVVPPLPDDIPILAAFVEERSALLEMFTEPSAPGEPTPRFLASRTSEGAQRYIATEFARIAPPGSDFDLAHGVVFRPFVASEGRTATTAVVVDCQLDSTGWHVAGDAVTDDNSNVWRRVPRVATMVKVDGRWLVDRVDIGSTPCSIDALAAASSETSVAGTPP
jgi:hypothetical protein